MDLSTMALINDSMEGNNNVIQYNGPAFEEKPIEWLDLPSSIVYSLILRKKMP